MRTHPNKAVARVGKRVADHMTAILDLFKPAVKITVVVRRPGHPDQDFIQTNDDLDAASEAILRRLRSTTTVLANS